jgi:Nif-specific regulatory protein
MSIVIEELVNATEATQGVINLLSQDTDEEPITIVRHEPESPEELPYRVSTLTAGWVLREKQVLKIDDLDSDERFEGLSSEDGRFASLLCCPMISRGNVIGLTSLVRSRSMGPFRDEHARLAGIVASQAAQILSNALLMDDLARNNELLQIARRKLNDENVRLRTELDQTFAFENIVGESHVMRQVLAMASKASTADSPVLILGQTGTGKELIARAVHFNSDRRKKPFVVKNCGVKTESLLESELFGHVKGAFTGAQRDKPGLFQEADGGTIFLDEIGDAPASTQAAILRVLESGEIRPVGGTKTLFVNVRVISATNKNLVEEIEADRFRRDLFYRLNTFTIEMPTLSQRRGDIPLLIRHSLHRLRTKLSNDQLSISPAALDRLSAYSWPGNVRQLEHELERAAVVSDRTGTIEVSHLSPEIAAVASPTSSAPAGTLRESVEDLEIAMITRTLQETGGNILQTSKILGLTRKGLKDKIARYGLAADSANRK